MDSERYGFPGNDKPLGAFVLLALVAAGVIVQLSMAPPAVESTGIPPSEAPTAASLAPAAERRSAPVPREADMAVPQAALAAEPEHPAGEPVFWPPPGEPVVQLAPAGRIAETSETFSPTGGSSLDEPLAQVAGTDPVLAQAEIPQAGGGETAERTDPGTRPGFTVPAPAAPVSQPVIDTPDPVVPDGEADNPSPVMAPPVEQPEALQTDVTPDPDSAGAQLVVLGPPVAEMGEPVTVIITGENFTDISHAPLRLSYNPDVLQFRQAMEGDLFNAGGAPTVFLASPGSTPGLTFIALSRMDPTHGVNGSGVLCTVTFDTVGTGESPIVIAGSRLMDQSARDVGYTRNDLHVSVR